MLTSGHLCPAWWNRAIYYVTMFHLTGPFLLHHSCCLLTESVTRHTAHTFPLTRRVLLPFGKVMKLRPGFKNSWGRALENWDSFVGLSNHRLVIPFLQIRFGVLGLEKQRETLRSSCCVCAVCARECGEGVMKDNMGAESHLLTWASGAEIGTCHSFGLSFMVFSVLSLSTFCCPLLLLLPISWFPDWLFSISA